MTTPHDAQSHVYRHEPQLPAERLILGDLVRPGMAVLDVGCAATGRSARLLREFGAEVHAFDINPQAVVEFSRRPDSGGITLAAADMGRLPYPDGAFELVLVAFHGLDYLLSGGQRRAVLAEFERVLAPGGNLVFNSFNKVGILLSPTGITARAHLVMRARYLLAGRLFRPTLIDVNGLELYQSLPGRVIRQVEEATGLRFAYATNWSGSSRSLALITLFASAPYFVFSRSDSGP